MSVCLCLSAVSLLCESEKENEVRGHFVRFSLVAKVSRGQGRSVPFANFVPCSCTGNSCTQFAPMGLLAAVAMATLKEPKRRPTLVHCCWIDWQRMHRRVTDRSKRRTPPGGGRHKGNSQQAKSALSLGTLSIFRKFNCY